MRTLSVILLTIILTACGGTKPTIVTEVRTIVVEPPAGLWQCPDVHAPPATATQAAVADYVLGLYQSHRICKESINAVQQFLEDAKRITKQVEK
jgi:hypothetical protein